MSQAYWTFYYFSIFGIKTTLWAEFTSSKIRCLKVKLVQTSYVGAPIDREERNLLNDSSYSRMPKIREPSWCLR